MEENYLSHFIQEEIFLIDEPDVKDKKTESSSISKDENTQNSEPQSPSAQKEPSIQQPIAEFAIWTHPLTPGDKELLMKILKSVNKQFEEVAIMEGISSYSPHYQVLLCFGYQKELEQKLGTQLSMYQFNQKNSQEVLLSGSLAELDEDRDAKVKLWAALKAKYQK